MLNRDVIQSAIAHDSPSPTIAITKLAPVILLLYIVLRSQFIPLAYTQLRRIRTLAQQQQQQYTFSSHSLKLLCVCNMTIDGMTTLVPFSPTLVFLGQTNQVYSIFKIFNSAKFKCNTLQVHTHTHTYTDTETHKQTCILYIHANKDVVWSIRVIEVGSLTTTTASTDGILCACGGACRPGGITCSRAPV